MPLLSPPVNPLPQEMTEPSSLSAAKALMVEKIWLTPLPSPAMPLLSPPFVGSPQVTTEPSSYSAAKA